MAKIPPEVLKAINEDVKRYREMRIAAAQRRADETEKKKVASDKRNKRLAPFKANRDRINDPTLLLELAERTLAGERLSRMSVEDFGYHPDTLRGKLSTWAHGLFYDQDFNDPRRHWKLKDQLQAAIELQRAALTNRRK